MEPSRLSFSRDVRFFISQGMYFKFELNFKSRISKFIRLPISEGIDSIFLQLLIDSFFKLVNRQISDGNDFKMELEITSVFKLVSKPISLGIDLFCILHTNFLKYINFSMRKMGKAP